MRTIGTTLVWFVVNLFNQRFPKKIFFWAVILLFAGQVYAQDAASEVLRVYTLDQTMQTLYAEKNAEFSDNQCNILGKSFWAAFARGGYQGAVYYIDRGAGADGAMEGKNGVLSET